MKQSWGHAYSTLIFSRQAKMSWLARFLPMAQILALIVAQIMQDNNNDNTAGDQTQLIIEAMNTLGMQRGHKYSKQDIQEALKVASQDENN